MEDYGRKSNLSPWSKKSKPSRFLSGASEYPPVKQPVVFTPE
jgi:hypothetical protein